METEIYKKLQQARKLIKERQPEKLGYNDFSKYKYFTPEQISAMVANVCFEIGLIHKFDLQRDENGLHGTLLVSDIDSESFTVFKMATDIPQIKATNVAQQLGGCATYTERYLLQIAFDIKDNSMDFDFDASNVITNEQMNKVYYLIENASYDDDTKEKLNKKVPKMTREQFDDAVSKLLLDQKAANENENMSQKNINSELDRKLKDEKA